MSAPNTHGSNLTKAIIVMPIDETGAPLGGSDNPQDITLIVDGAPVSNSNPIPTVVINP